MLLHRLDFINLGEVLILIEFELLRELRGLLICLLDVGVRIKLCCTLRQLDGLYGDIRAVVADLL